MNALIAMALDTAVSRSARSETATVRQPLAAASIEMHVILATRSFTRTSSSTLSRRFARHAKPLARGLYDSNLAYIAKQILVAKSRNVTKPSLIHGAYVAARPTRHGIPTTRVRELGFIGTIRTTVKPTCTMSEARNPGHVTAALPFGSS